MDHLLLAFSVCVVPARDPRPERAEPRGVPRGQPAGGDGRRSARGNATGCGTPWTCSARNCRPLAPPPTCRSARAAQLLAGTDHGYDHVVVDEAQDLHPAQWRVLRAAVVPGPDDLFITGDPHQRIYDSRVSLNALGISVTGRSSRLRVNYRSTEEILSWSTGVLVGVADRGPRRRRRGEPRRLPVVAAWQATACRGAPTGQAEVAALVERVGEWLRQGVRSSEIAVCARFNMTLSTVRDELADAGIPRSTSGTSPAGRSTECESPPCTQVVSHVLRGPPPAVPETRGCSPRCGVPRPGR
ncbi:UvrD-helicase domain-containing protein [Micromonospora sp. KC721]|uniref:UvrD-helicase domain-containing protein n=1 Tax=Micromonospora sp. KC721 TaxID=2530380 RepID=UPI001FB7D0A3|nr:UvrD-helicase domain-containing protein [Micromonospora sp. KC721]